MSISKPAIQKKEEKKLAWKEQPTKAKPNQLLEVTPISKNRKLQENFVENIQGGIEVSHALNLLPPF